MMEASAETVYLRSYLAPLNDLLSRADVTDIYVNKPGEVWVETLGGAIECLQAPALDEATLHRLARQIAALSHQGISRESPLLGATLPDGSRVQIVAPPATRGPMVMAIRRHVSVDLQLRDYASTGAFDNTASGDAASSRPRVSEEMEGLLARRDFAGALSVAVRARLNILISGGTSTGKTTFMNALLREVPPTERLILIEDTPELHVVQPNAVGLQSSRSALGEAAVTADDLLTASLRMRPDRIIVGELRGPEAYTFLRAINTGHPGSMSTIHADSPARAVEQLTLLVLQTGTRLSREDVAHYARSTVDVFVQLARIGGRRVIDRVDVSEFVKDAQAVASARL